MAIRPVTIIVIPNPSSPLGTLAYLSFLLIAAMEERNSTRLNSIHFTISRIPCAALNKNKLI